MRVLITLKNNISELETPTLESFLVQIPQTKIIGYDNSIYYVELPEVYLSQLINLTSFFYTVEEDIIHHTC